jgi:hypothetical protein
MRRPGVRSPHHPPRCRFSRRLPSCLRCRCIAPRTHIGISEDIRFVSAPSCASDLVPGAAANSCPTCSRQEDSADQTMLKKVNAMAPGAAMQALAPRRLFVENQKALCISDQTSYSGINPVREWQKASRIRSKSGSTRGSGLALKTGDHRASTGRRKTHTA